MSTSDATVRIRTISWEDPAATAARGAELSGLAYLQAILAGELAPAPIALLMGFGAVEVQEGRAVFVGEPAEHLYNPNGTVHGGYAATLLDSAMGCAVQTLLPAGTGYTTLELKVNLVRAMSASTGPVRCTGTVIHPGRRVATAEGRIEDEAGRLYAHGTTTCLVLASSA